MRMRLTVSGIIRNEEGKVLLCKMPEDRGAYPGQWAIPGGGVEDGEKIEETLVREMGEEVGLKVGNLERFYFQDDVRTKIKPGGEGEEIYFVHLVFECEKKSGEVKLNEEFEEYAWVGPKEAMEYDLNDATRLTFAKLIDSYAGGCGGSGEGCCGGGCHG